MHRFSGRPMSSALQAKQFACPNILPEIAISPHAARALWCATNVDYLSDRRNRRPHPDDAVRGLPARHRHDRAGERLTERAQPHDRLSQDVRDCFNTFPGFDRRNPGVYRKVDANGRIRLYTYVVSEYGARCVWKP